VKFTPSGKSRGRFLFSWKESTRFLEKKLQKTLMKMLRIFFKIFLVTFFLKKVTRIP